MGSAISYLMERANARSEVPHPLICKYNNYGVNNCAYGEPTETESAVYRMRCMPHPVFERLCHDYYYKLGNTVSNLRRLCAESGEAPAIAYRPVEQLEVIETVSGSGPAVQRTVTHYGPRVTISYTRLWHLIEAFGLGLQLCMAEGALPQQRPPSTASTAAAKPRVIIYAETRYEWIVSAFGLWTQDFVVVTAYPNLGEDGLLHAWCEAECAAVICEGRLVPTVARLLASAQLPPACVVYLDELPAEVKPSARVVPWDAVVARGEAALFQLAAGAAAAPTELAPRLPSSNDELALIMYTSGTTGNPKGVMHTHGSIAAGVAILNDKLVWVEPYLERHEQTYCAFLPLAHIMEFACINIFLHRHFVVCFGHPRTLTDEFARPHGDFSEYRPLFIMAVPRVYDVLRKSVQAKLPPPGTLKRRLFEQAYAAKLRALREGRDTPYYNRKIFRSIRDAFGGRMTLMLSGGGQLSAATQEFTNVCMNLLVQGYGMTETVACGSTQLIGSLEPNNVGELMKACELKLVDVEEFKHTDKPEPRGEICLRGPFLFKGYYKQPELTREALDAEGWFHTGDVGSISNRDGELRIVGRVKALAKNALGEYIALETLESIYSTNVLSLPNSTCILVHPQRNYICALVLTSATLVQTFLQTHEDVAARVRVATYPAVLDDPIFIEAATHSFRETATQAHRMPFELVRSVCLLTDEWTCENNMLTAALKLKRSAIDSVYHTQIAALFESE